MIKLCVKKPYTVLVGVIMVLVLGYVSFTHLTTDMLPSMELPYVVVFTTDPGSSPEKIESSITEPLEESLGTVNGVANVNSTSSENYSMVMLEFEEDTNMDSAMVRLSTELETVKDQLPDSAGTPMLMEISMDMMSSFMVSVDKDDCDIYELSEFTEENIIPVLERQEGVASVDGNGIVTKSVEVRLNQEKIDKVNDKVLAQTSDKLDDARKELDSSKSKLSSQRSALSGQQGNLSKQQDTTYDQLAKYTKMMDEAMATSASYNTQLTSLQTSKTALTAEKEGYESKVVPAYNSMNQALAAMGLGDIPSLAKDKDKFDAAKAMIDAAAEVNEQAAALAQSFTWDNIKQMNQIVNTRIPQIETELANLKTEIAAAKMAKEKVDDAVSEAKKNYEKVEKSKMSAVTAFGSAGGQIAAASAQLASASAQLDAAQEEYDAARKEALENANVDSLVDKDTLSQLLTAQNLEMPAGYISDGDDEYILKVGDEIGSLDELINLTLCYIDGIGNVKLKDVADITIIDDADSNYAKVNGNDAVLLNISKSSTAGTSEVSTAVNKAIDKLQKEHEGLHITTFMDQGNYIKLIIKSVLSNLIIGAILAVIVLIVFLKDARPTIVVAFSIPFSVLFAIVLMYFSDITLNMISLSGLALGVGMLVDNSIVVIENIYRLRNEGMSAPKAALAGARQVAGAIFSSTLTTVSVFLPIVFTTGLAKQLFVDMALTIAYSLGASLLVALTVVPAMSSSILKNTAPKKHPLFDRMMNGYEKVLRFCLRRKFVPILVALALLIFAGIRTASTGLTVMPDMSAESVSVSMEVPDGTSKEDAYKMADDLLERMNGVKNVDKIGVITSSSTASMISSSLASNVNDYKNYSYFVIPKEADTKSVKKLTKDLEKSVEDFEGEVTVSASGMDASAMFGSGMQIDISGEDLDTLLSISYDMEDILGDIKGLENISNGQEDADEGIKIVVNKKKAMKYGLTVAQIYGELAKDLKTDTTSTTLSIEDGEYEVVIVDETNELTVDNLMSRTFETTTQDDEGKTVTKTRKLEDFAKKKDIESVASVNRENLVRYMSVTADTLEGYNTTLLSRDVKEKLDKYEVPEGYTIELAGETESVNETMTEFLKMIGLAIIFIYLIMVAQFQSLLSPFIVIFTIPLAFTGGLLAVIFAGDQISMLSMVGFLVLSGVIVNNGIVFVDYVNQLRIAGMEKKEALVETGKTRMRPILMTALTTILAMSTMLFSTGLGSEMGKGMAIVVIGGLVYATFMTLFVVPVLYDIFYRKKMKVIDVDDI